MQLLAKYGDIDTLYANIDKEKGALKEKLIDNKDLAYVSKTLATIVKNADVDFDLNNCGLYELNGEVHDMLTKLQFRSVISRLQFDDAVVEARKADVETVSVNTASELDGIVEIL